ARPARWCRMRPCCVCGQDLFRANSINGIPQWGSSWQVAAGDGLIEATIEAVCAAGVDLLAGS
ncbi:MAG: hypothetical protein ACKOCA_10270, partial [Vulcanococcus sp.]